MKEVFKEYRYDGMTYSVSNYGKVVGVRGVIKARLDKDGYLVVTLGKLKSKRSACSIHRIVAILFLDNPQGLHEVNHLDCNRANPKADNLEWSTHIDNVRYSVKKGNYDNDSKGENNIRATLKDEDVLAIRKLFEEGVNIADISKLYNANWNKISRIVKRETWTHI